MQTQNRVMEALVKLSTLQQVGVNQHSPAEAKIALFRSLFHGREDVYPRRTLRGVIVSDVEDTHESATTARAHRTRRLTPLWLHV